jgi:hypothetical protein
MVDYHEPYELLSDKTKDVSKALSSLKEEIEAINWYNQRVDTANDEEIKAIMAHNRDEEIEHACMAIEWLRRNMEGWDEELSTYLFKEGKITELEEAAEGEESEGDDDSLKIGDLK